MKSYKTFLKESIDQLVYYLEVKYPIDLNISHKESNVYSIDYIRSFEKNLGIGTKVMKEISDYADKYNIILVLHPSSKEVPEHRLKNFYKRFGFREHVYRSDYIETMTRFPK